MSPQEAYDNELAATGSSANAEHAREITEMAKRENESEFVGIPPGSRENWDLCKKRSREANVTWSERMFKAWALTALEAKYGHRATSRITGVYHSTLTSLTGEMSRKYPFQRGYAISFGLRLQGPTCAEFARANRRKAEASRMLSKMSRDELGDLLAEVRRMIQEKCD